MKSPDKERLTDSLASTSKEIEMRLVSISTFCRACVCADLSPSLK